MSAFNFNLRDVNGKCVSKNGITCSFDNGFFDLDGYQTEIGNSFENNWGGKGGFVGPNHEYFLYCGSRCAEIAVAKFNRGADEWEHHGGLRWLNSGHAVYGFFKNIWFAKKKLTLIFEPKNKYRSYLMEHEDLAGENVCIKLDLFTGGFTGITKKQFDKQRHSIVDEDSKWPPLSSKNRSSNYSSSGSTLFEVPRPILTQQQSVLEILDNMKEGICACLDKASQELTIILNDRVR
ncbi:hypothetical protein GQ44DRAFT_813620 [Phaeosphaeriaceae sp. PMI808]|nr:hypothetical protein GQ44DRAFT_813620 [Phaeosphaeriaceae sp. PMI808]